MVPAFLLDDADVQSDAFQTRSAGAKSSLIYARYCPKDGEQLTPKKQIEFASSEILKKVARNEIGGWQQCGGCGAAFDKVTKVRNGP